MTPGLTGIDHVHVYVSDRAAAERWYEQVLGFKRVEALMDWATPTGPLTVEDAGGTIHLALFERDDPQETSSLAFATDAEGFLAWKENLESKGLGLRLADHRLAYSLYFTDPWGNYHEITTYERDEVAAGLQAGSGAAKANKH